MRDLHESPGHFRRIEAKRTNVGPADPRYPDIRVRLRTRNPLAAISAVRHALRRAGVATSEIRQFTEEAVAVLAEDTIDPVRADTFGAWAVVDFVEAS